MVVLVYILICRSIHRVLKLTQSPQPRPTFMIRNPCNQATDIVDINHLNGLELAVLIIWCIGEVFEA
jgi:hypothetical protein